MYKIDLSQCISELAEENVIVKKTGDVFVLVSMRLIDGLSVHETLHAKVKQSRVQYKTLFLDIKHSNSNSSSSEPKRNETSCR